MSEAGKNYDQAIARLKVKHLKRTRQREALIAVLTKKHGPFTMDEFQKLIRPVTCDLVTIYRCLAQFEEIGLVRRCDFGDGVARYELADENEHHHHVICRKCQRVENFEDDCLLETLEKIVRKRGFEDVSHSLEFFGVCPRCRQSN